MIGKIHIQILAAYYEVGLLSICNKLCLILQVTQLTSLVLHTWICKSAHTCSTISATQINIEGKIELILIQFCVLSVKNEWLLLNSNPYLMYRLAQKRTHVFESACDFFLWGYLKSKVYVRKPRTFDDLKVSIREEMLVNVMQNFEERLRTCVWQEGRHLSDIIFRNWVINVSNQNCIYYRLFWC